MRVEQPTHQRGDRPIVLRLVLTQRQVHHAERGRSLAQRPEQHHEREVQVAQSLGVLPVVRREPRRVRGPILSPDHALLRRLSLERDVDVDAGVHAG